MISGSLNKKPLVGLEAAVGSVVAFAAVAASTSVAASAAVAASTSVASAAAVASTSVVASASVVAPAAEVASTASASEVAPAELGQQLRSEEVPYLAEAEEGYANGYSERHRFADISCCQHRTEADRCSERQGLAKDD